MEEVQKLTKGRDFRVTSGLETFLKYTELELQRRRDSGESFNENLYNEAVTVVRNHLKLKEQKE